MSGLKQRPDKRARKPAHVAEPVHHAQPPVPRLPERPPPAKAPSPTPESETSQDKLGSLLMALAGKTPSAMPEALVWNRAGAVTVLPRDDRSQVDARTLTQAQGRAQAVLEALIGQRGRTVATRDAAAAWAAVVAALGAGRTVVVGGGEEPPPERHGRPRAALVTALSEVDGEKRATLVTGDGASETVAFADLCRDFAEIAVADPV